LYAAGDKRITIENSIPLGIYAVNVFNGFLPTERRPQAPVLPVDGCYLRNGS